MTDQTNPHAQTIINKTWNQFENAFHYAFVFEFRTKERYLAFRRLWKENYASLSRAIRGQKAQIKALLRKHEYAGLLQSQNHNFRREATIQLLMLQAAKREAHRQYLASKQATK